MRGRGGGASARFGVWVGGLMLPESACDWCELNGCIVRSDMYEHVRMPLAASGWGCLVCAGDDVCHTAA